MIEQKLITDFKRPKSVDFKIDHVDKYRGMFTAKPYEPGFGTTIGNSLRRTLLSSVPGYAIIAVKFSKINNEYQNIKGVHQDTAEIIVNMKNVAIGIKDKNLKSRVLHFDVKGKTDFRARDLKKDELIIIGNNDFLIFSSNKEADFSFDVQIEWGRGYIPSERFDDAIEVEGAIPIDANYSPIINVAFQVEKIRIGNRSDFEKLNMEVTTNGIINPEEALKQAAQILKESYLTFNNIEAEEPVTLAVDDRKDRLTDEKDRIFYKSIYSIEFTVRTHFFLKKNDIREVGQLVTRTEEDLKTKNFADDSIINDITEKLVKLDLSLGMKNINYVQKSIM